ncbi:MAG: chalcone isomerase family protein [Myxococcales bacterium]
MSALRRLFLPSLLLLAAVAAAGEIVEPETSVHFDTRVLVGGETFECVGAGVRKILFFKVYAVAYCVQPGATEAVERTYARSAYPGLVGPALAAKLASDQGFFDALANAPGDKLVEMHMVRNVSRKQLADAFHDSLSKILPAPKVARVVAAVPSDARSGQTALVHSRGGELVIEIGGQLVTIDDPETARVIWRVWLGPDSVTPSLKRSIAERVIQPTAAR